MIEVSVVRPDGTVVWTELRNPLSNPEAAFTVNESGNLLLREYEIHPPFQVIVKVNQQGR